MGVVHACAWFVVRQLTCVSCHYLPWLPRDATQLVLQEQAAYEEPPLCWAAGFRSDFATTIQEYLPNVMFLQSSFAHELIDDLGPGCQVCQACQPHIRCAIFAFMLFITCYVLSQD
jgi:hypothetical protein